MELKDIAFPIDFQEEKLQAFCAKKAGIPESKVRTFCITKKSFDARHKGDIKKVYSVIISDKEEKEESLEIPQVKESATRPIIIGFGPAGIFCAYILAQAGLKPIVFERGASLEERQKCVDLLWQKGVLNTATNAQFGEGGAGAFSDGKLNTGIKDKFLCSYVLKSFVEGGAPKEIEYIGRPHVGTDKLTHCVKYLREKIIALGGEIFFCAKLLDISDKNGIIEITVNDNKYTTENLVLAIGHSARDTYEMLCEKGLLMEQKPFAVGVRAEHLQKDINKAMYGIENSPFLPPADYRLAEHTALGGVYSFCMCPGGYVVCGSSEENQVATNGMSYHSRDGKNANAALLVGVDAKDFGTDLFAGLHFQRELEKLAYELGKGGYKAPCQKVGDFLANKKSKSFGKVQPTYKPGVTPSNLASALPERISGALSLGIKAFAKKIRGYDDSEALLTGIETRSSAPIRIIRGEDYKSISNKNIYPCGEGCGYAGGIMSAAVDGIKVAFAIIRDKQTQRK